MKQVAAHHQSQQFLRLSLIAGVGGLLAIAMLGILSRYAHSPFIMAPFGASYVLLFSAPANPLSQPANVIGGHLTATFVGLITRLVYRMNGGRF